MINITAKKVSVKVCLLYYYFHDRYLQYYVWVIKRDILIDWINS